MTENVTPNHGLNRPPTGSETGTDDVNWGTELNTNTSHIDEKLVVRDTDTNASDYTPYGGALYYATDTEQWYIGDGTAWNVIPWMSESPDVIAASIDDLTVETGYDEGIIGTDEQTAMIDVGDGSTVDRDGILNAMDVELSSTNKLRGVKSDMYQTSGSDSQSTASFLSRVTCEGDSHNQGLCFYGRLIQKDSSEVGEQPPSAGVYIDSRGSTVRPFAAFVDDAESIWQHGIVLNGDYSDKAIRTPNWTLTGTGTVDRDGTIVENAVGPKTGDYVVQETDETIFVDSSSNTVEIQLQSAYNYTGMRKKVKDHGGAAGTNSVNIITDDSATIDGQSSHTLDSNYESVTLVGDGTNWYTI